MKKYYAVIDTNVLVSVMLKWNSVPGSIMELAFDGPIVPVLNADILAEYREVLMRPKFRFTILKKFTKNSQIKNRHGQSEKIDRAGHNYI